MDRRWDAEDEGFKTFETAEVLGTWRQNCTPFNAPWKRLRSDTCHVRPLPALVFLCQWIYTLRSDQSLLDSCSWTSFLVPSSRWDNLFMESEFLCRCVMHLLPDPLVFAVGSMSHLLMDTWSHLMMVKNKRMFCCLHSSSWFESVEQLTKDTAGICCGQKVWTGVGWQLKGFASSVKETVPDSLLPGTPSVIWSKRHGKSCFSRYRVLRKLWLIFLPAS